MKLLDLLYYLCIYLSWKIYDYYFNFFAVGKVFIGFVEGVVKISPLLLFTADRVVRDIR